jgi:hypothetical protein
VLISWKDGLRVNFKIADDRVFDLLDLAENISTNAILVEEHAIQEEE